MILKKDYVLLCENLIIDQTGKVTIVNAFDTIYTESLPAIHAALYFVAQIIVEGSEKKDEDSTSFDLKVLSPSKNAILSNTMKLKINSALPTQKIILAAQLNGMPIEELGTYQFILTHNSKMVVQRSLEVVKGGEADVTSQQI